MPQYMMVLEIGDAPYQEFSEQGVTEEELLKELKGEIQDELDEYDLEGLLTQMLSSDNHKNTVAFAPKKDGEEDVTRFLLVCREMS